MDPYTQRTSASAAHGGQRSGGAAPRKRVLVIGGNTGIGYEMALGLAKKNFEVTVAGRDDARSMTAKAKIEREVPGNIVHTIHIDLADLSSVKDCAARLSAQEPFDVLMLNAGVLSRTRRLTKDGFELHFGVNFLGQYAFTSLMLPQLLAANKPVRIIITSSAVHNIGSLNLDNVMREKNYFSWEAYGQSKMALIMWGYELARRLQGTNITVNATHPGTVNTQLGREFWSVAVGHWVAGVIAPVMFLTPRQGAEVGIYLASSDQVENVTGKYWAETKKPTPSARQSYDTDLSKRLMELAEKLTGIPPVLSPSPATARGGAAESARGAEGARGSEGVKGAEGARGSEGAKGGEPPRGAEGAKGTAGGKAGGGGGQGQPMSVSHIMGHSEAGQGHPPAATKPGVKSESGAAHQHTKATGRAS